MVCFVVEFIRLLEFFAVRTSDVLDYNTHLATYGEPRRVTGFQTALDEIREAAEKKGLVVTTETPTTQPADPTNSPLTSPNSGRLQRTRVPSRLIANDDFVVPQARRKLPTADGSKTEAGAPDEFKEPQPLLSAVARKRTDSTSSTERSRKRLLSEKFGIDLSDIEPTLSTVSPLSRAR